MSGIELEAEIGLTIGGVHDAVHGALNKHHKEKPKPLYGRKAGAVLSDGTHLNVIDLGSPPTGRLWCVTFITLYGTDDHTVVAAVTGAVYTGNPSSLSLMGLVLSALPFPSNTQISDDVLWVHANENLCVQTSAPGAANQQFGANAIVQEWRDHEKTQKTGR